MRMEEGGQVGSSRLNTVRMRNPGLAINGHSATWPPPNCHLSSAQPPFDVAALAVPACKTWSQSVVAGHMSLANS